MSAPADTRYARSRPTALPTLDDYTGFVRRHAWLLLASVVLGAVGGGAWAYLQPRVYEAKASIALAPVPAYASTEPSREPPEVSIDTDAQLFRAPVVVDAVAQVTGRSPEDVPDVVVITATPLSRVLHVRVTDTSPEEAAAGANAAALTFVEARRESLGSLQQDQVIALAARINELRDRLAARSARLQGGLAQDAAAVELQVLEQRFLDLQRARAVPAEVIRRAVVPPEPEPRTVSVPAVTAAMSGLLLAILVGIALDQRRRRRTVREGSDAPIPGMGAHPVT